MLRGVAVGCLPRGGHDPSDRTGMCVRDGSQILPVRIARFLSPPQAPKDLGGFAVFSEIQAILMLRTACINRLYSQGTTENLSAFPMQHLLQLNEAELEL